MLDIITNIDWSDPAIIVIGIGAVVIVVAGGYLYKAWSEKKWPFDR